MKKEKHSPYESWFYQKIDLAHQVLSKAIDRTEDFPKEDKLLVRNIVKHLHIIDIELLQILYSTPEERDLIFGDEWIFDDGDDEDVWILDDFDKL